MTISSCIPVEPAIRQEHVDEWDLEIVGREKDRRIEEELAYLLRVPGDYCAKAETDMFPRLVSILTDGKGDERGRCRDLLEPDMRRVATEEANHD